MPLLEGRVAVVTGGASGNGRAIALAFARHGAAAVVVADRRAEPREGGEPTTELIERETSTRAVFQQTDVARVRDVRAAVEAADALGGVDVLVNNAGIFRPEPFLEVTEDDYAELMDVNLRGVFFGAQAAARRMIDKGAGSIINVSSIAGMQGAGGFVTYCASKGGVRLMTYALAQTLGEHGIRVNAIHPGLIDTTMTRRDVPIFGSPMGDAYIAGIPLRRAGQPDDVAGAAVFLASDLASYVTGESILVDGGFVNTQ